jgi:tetratricopeptide (TPR) repeat protein
MNFSFSTFTNKKLNIPATMLTIVFLNTIFLAPTFAQDLFQSNIGHSCVVRFKNAQNLRKKGHADQSIGLLKGLVAEYPDYFLAWYNLGLAYTDKGDYVKGAAALDKAIQVQLKLMSKNQIQPEFTVYNTAGWAHMQLNQYDIAEKYLKVALANLNQLPSPDSQSRVLNNYGLLKMKQNNYAAAKTYFNKAAALGNPMASDNLGYLTRLQQLKKASHS